MNTNENNHNHYKKSSTLPQKCSNWEWGRARSQRAHTTPDLSFLFRKNLKYTHRHTLKYSHSANDTSLCQTSVFLVNNSLWEKDIAKCNVHIRMLERQEAGAREAGAYYKAPFLHSTHNDKWHHLEGNEQFRWGSGWTMQTDMSWAGLQTARAVATETVAVILIPRLMLRNNVMF